MATFRKWNLGFLILLLMGSGINHLLNPKFYVELIPRYLPQRALLNQWSGGAEIVLGAFLVFPKTRRISALGIMLLLAAFLPVHIQMILDAPLPIGQFCVSKPLAWLRLAFQPALMVWSWWCGGWRSRPVRRRDV